MALKEYDTLDAVPESLRADYAKSEDGKFRPVFEGSPGWGIENVAGLRNTVAKLRGEVKERDQKLEAFGDLDPAASRAAMKKAAEMDSWTPEAKAREMIEATKKELATKHAAEIATERAARASLDAENEALLIDSVAAEKIAKLGGSPKLLLPHVKAHAFRDRDAAGKPVVRVKGADGHARTTLKQGSTDYMGLEEFVETMRADPEFALGFKGSGSAGSGAGGSPAGGGTQTAKTISRADLVAGNVDLKAIASGAVTVQN